MDIISLQKLDWNLRISGNEDDIAKVFLMGFQLSKCLPPAATKLQEEYFKINRSQMQIVSK